ncbi:ExbD/TolR family protein [Microbulbifer hydrolyticus]|uniref:Biopolymer transport protein ExbD n=1 Tax=Microbulbifer hydrolyticus TaxID=48074 RepID=A0A6P1T7R3_9GAMM|nr:biopolymer transporter ExbD [Microbulbifer hydrolyticus]MBB5211536.1 biopolymer transport protein ExbD [Microbulbifer hydrolyticus]QHQ37723.1 biopolymer transporter ExbD [Microbulbifer hydrolyticus]
MAIRRRLETDPDLDITSFMSLMTVLVPVLLLNMVFSHISVLNLNLPGMSDPSVDEQKENRQLEMVLRADHIDINYPAGIRVKRIANRDGKPDFKLVSDVLQEIKRSLREKDIDKKDLVILSEPGTPYRTLVSAMDTARSFRAVVAASVVDAELFPQISLGDAPVQDEQLAGK